MEYLYAFLFAGVACALAQILFNHTKLTAGHVTSLYTVLGAILSFFGIYEKCLQKFGAGASVLISNFGHMLYTSALEGYKAKGILGIFSELLCKSSAAITAAIVFAFVFSFIFKPRD
ncbi:MAG: SpoVA/SpoVAEb family sporulation membrane protein [Bacilli bacterium]|nr:SpoVA/SpoVAEb family sporulation membrane protein [Bacilli bacterium]